MSTKRIKTVGEVSTGSTRVTDGLDSFRAPGGTRTPNPFLRTELLFH